jgi:RNA-directed DNA polymerase
MLTEITYRRSQVIWKDPEKKWMAIHQMQQKGYKALPLRRVYIPKSHGKKRPLGIPMLYS